MRRMANQAPRPGPCRSTAILAYSEHVGSYRHAGGNQGETAPWYTRISSSVVFFNTAPTPHTPPNQPPILRSFVCTQTVSRALAGPGMVAANSLQATIAFAGFLAPAVSIGSVPRSCAHTSVRRWQAGGSDRQSSSEGTHRRCHTRRGNPSGGVRGSPWSVGGGLTSEAAAGWSRHRVVDLRQTRCFRRTSSLTVSEWRPFLRRRASTARPALVFIRARKPWTLRRFRRLGFLYVGCMLGILRSLP